MASSFTTNIELLTPANQSMNGKTSDTIIIAPNMDHTVISSQAQIIHQVSGKHQMLPLVYLQTPSKITTHKTNTNNVIIPHVQFQNITQTKHLTATSIAPQSLLIGKSPIVLPKPQNIQTIPMGQKNGVTYLTMLKPVTTTSEANIITGNRLPISTINKIKPDGLHVIASKPPQKFILSPMPKMTTNRLPITATTNAVQPKISFMPITIPPANKQKIYNFKISDGQIQQNPETLIIDNKFVDMDNLHCNEQIAPANKMDDKSYQISIKEDSNSHNDSGYTISVSQEDGKNKMVELKETPKFSKHGVSILKKTYNFLDKREKPKHNQPIFKSITTVSDNGTKAVRITPERNKELPQKKNERRRKSTICLRRDYDDVDDKIKVPKLDNNVTKSEELSTPKLNTNMPKLDTNVAKLDTNVAKLDTNVPKVDTNMAKLDTSVETAETDGNKTPKNASDIDILEINKKITEDLEVFTDDYDVAKLLTWEDGIGTLPGSDLKFQMNEFGFLEYLTKDEYRKIYYKQVKLKETDKKKVELQEEMRCLECGCYGMPSEFISPKYCSLDCQTSGEKAALLKLKRSQRKILKKANADFVKNESEEEDNSKENSQDKCNYPWTCQKKGGFSWAKYLDHLKAQSVPVKLFKEAFPYNRNGFKLGMKLEGIDPQHPSYFCVLTVSQVIGYRLRLHFDGYPENYDFWINADCMNIFPVGYCEKFGHTLKPPPRFGKKFNWNVYLKYTLSHAAPKHLFASRSGNTIFPNGFRTGMKLEAVDRTNTSLVCVATIINTMDNRILVHFDSWDDIYDYWADATSPYIHPVGWCDQNGHNLTPPNDYPNPETFTWERYLKETKSSAAPARAFKQRATNGFKKGMRLECVDKRVPQLIRVATVDDVKDHQIRIIFDGWPDKYGYWVDDDNPDIHPAGWCQKTGHPLEPPLTPDDVYDFLECATVGCRGYGNINGPGYIRHSNQTHCPYAEENIDCDKTLPDRLLSPGSRVQAAVPVSREPYDISKVKIESPPKLPNLDDTIVKTEWPEDDYEELHNDDHNKMLMDLSDSPRIKTEDMDLDEYNDTEVKMYEKHSEYLNDLVKGEVDPREWSCDDVVDFVNSVPGCRSHSQLFLKNNIDGISLLMLSQQDLREILNFKLGPAITLYNCIIMLRRSVLNNT